MQVLRTQLFAIKSARVFRYSSCFVAIGPFTSVQVELALEQVEVQDDAGLVTIETEDVASVEGQQPLELCDQAVDPQRGHPDQACQRGGRDRPALAVERRQDLHDD